MIFARLLPTDCAPPMWRGRQNPPPGTRGPEEPSISRPAILPTLRTRSPLEAVCAQLTQKLDADLRAVVPEKDRHDVAGRDRNEPGKTVQGGRPRAVRPRH